MAEADVEIFVVSVRDINDVRCCKPDTCNAGSFVAIIVTANGLVPLYDQEKLEFRQVIALSGGLNSKPEVEGAFALCVADGIAEMVFKEDDDVREAGDLKISVSSMNCS